MNYVWLKEIAIMKYNVDLIVNLYYKYSILFTWKSTYIIAGCMTHIYDLEPPTDLQLIIGAP